MDDFGTVDVGRPTGALPGETTYPALLGAAWSVAESMTGPCGTTALHHGGPRSLGEHPLQSVEPGWLRQVFVEAGLQGTAPVALLAVARKRHEQYLLQPRLLPQPLRQIVAVEPRASPPRVGRREFIHILGARAGFQPG
jgi:hypothetical protein